MYKTKTEWRHLVSCDDDLTLSFILEYFILYFAGGIEFYLPAALVAVVVVLGDIVVVAAAGGEPAAACGSPKNDYIIRRFVIT